MIFWNSTGAVTGYGGYYYEELSWLALRLNFRFDHLFILLFRALEFHFPEKIYSNFKLTNKSNK